MTLNLLVVGKNGQLARSLQRKTKAAHVPAVFLGRDELDLTTFQRLPEAFELFKPTIVINAAAYTAVDKAESDVKAAYALNATGPAKLAALLAERSVPFIHISTDYVFDGTQSRPYTETDQVNPQSVYGKSKLAGENAVLAENPDSVILRTAWIYSLFGNNFVKTILRLAKERDEISVVNDQFGCPTNALDIAEALLTISQSVIEGGAGDRSGIYHLTNSGSTCWMEFASQIIEYSARAGGASCNVNPIPTSEYPTPAPRPLNSRLDNSLAENNFKVSLRNWRVALKDLMNETNSL